MNKSSLDILSYRAQYQSDKKAYIFLQDGETESGSLTYGELDNLARAIASHLQSFKGERALLLYPSGLEFITAFFGCLYAGVIAVPVYPPRRNQKLSRLLSIVNDAQATIALTTASILADIEQRWSSYAELAQLKLVATDTIESQKKDFVPHCITPDSLAFLQYTSGSTGTPKGVMVTHGNIIHNQQIIQDANKHTEESTYVSWLPLSHDLGLGNAIQAVFIGALCIIMPPVAFLQRPIRWLQAISRYQAHTSGGPNFAYDLCVQKVPSEERQILDLSSWQVAFNGAEQIQGSTLEQFQRAFSECGFQGSAFSPCYGLAESTAAVTGSPKGAKPIVCSFSKTALSNNRVVTKKEEEEDPAILVSSGITWLANQKVAIVEPSSGNLCSDKQVGEIWVSSPSVAAGYWNRPNATKETFINNWLYQIHWLPQSTTTSNQSINQTKPGSWLLFSSCTGIGKHLLESLEQQDRHCILVTPGENYQQLDSQHYQINPINGSEFERLLQESLEQQPPLQGIIHLWSLESALALPTSAQELNKSQELGCGSVLHLVQALVKNQDIENRTLWLVTQGSQSVGNESVNIQFQQTSLWGLGRVIAQEYGKLQCRCLDLDPTTEDSQAAQALLQELLSPSNESQIAYRQGVRHVARLERQQKINTSTQSRLQIPLQQPFQLKLSEYGLLDKLMFQPMERRSPAPSEVEIQVKAVGLNFRDVLNTLGLLKDYYAQYFGITSAQQLTFGFECVGTIVTVGEGVSHLQVGDEVMANLLPDAFSSFVTTRAEFVVAKPQQISLTEAATIPLAFLTAYYGLHHLAQVTPTDKVLIHAAAGGVGQAAVQLAQQKGAEIFATASPSKWEFLKSMGVQHVMNSRTLDFAEQVMNITQGQGVDVVFNSLNGEYIPKNFEILAPGGRFIEIGKIGIWDQNQVKQFRSDAEYFPFDLGEVAQQNPSLIAQMQRSLAEEFEQGCLKPLLHKVFPMEQVVEAFRYMQQSKHIGKVVISMSETANNQVPIQAEASYLISGGLGALGLNTAKWMVQQGAKHLVLTGHRQPSQKAQETIKELEKFGAQILVLCGDISQQEDVTKILSEIETFLPPLRGVIHAAGVLDDGLLLNINWEQFKRVMAPKVQGAWHLHYLTQEKPLDFFVCFSSIASILGSPGQGNYAAANAFMDGLVHHRRCMGLPGLSINWGPWSQGGMISRLDNQHLSRIQTQGITPITPELGLQVLAKLLEQNATQVGVLPINWSQFLGQLSGEIKMPLVEVFSLGQTRVKAKDFRLLEQLETASPRGREKLLITHLQSQVAQILGMNADKIDVQQPLNTMGLDSLMAVELRNRLQAGLLVDIPIVKFIEDTSIVDLGTELNEQLTQIDRNQATEQENNISNVYPLSYGQQALWFLWQLEPKSHTYNVSFAARIGSEVDITGMQKAFEALIERHPILRTNYPKLGTEPIQQINNSQQLDFKQIDAQYWSEDELKAKVLETHQQNFDLERESIMRVRWFTRFKQEHILLITIHHIACDGWSIDILIQELSKLYHAQLLGVEASLPLAKYSYQDYIDWQRKMLGGTQGEKLWSYWQDKLNGDLPVLNLATDKQRPPIQTYNGGSIKFKLSSKLTSQLKELAQTERVTFYMMLLAAFEVLLYRYTGQEDILIGSWTSGRSQPEFAPIIGCFANPVVMRANLSNNPNFKNFLSQVRQTVLEALTHQDYPFALIVEKLQPYRDPSRSPIFQASFNLQQLQQSRDIQNLFINEIEENIDWGGLKLRPFEIPQQEGQNDLDLEIFEGNYCMKGNFKYNTDLFKEQTIERMVSYFHNLLEEIVKNPSQKVGNFNLFSEWERHQLLVEWNDPIT